MGVNRVWLLDSGSLVIDRSHVMWNIDAGNPVRFPVFSVLIDHSDGLFLFGRTQVNLPYQAAA